MNRISPTWYQPFQEQTENQMLPYSSLRPGWAQSLPNPSCIPIWTSLTIGHERLSKAVSNRRCSWELCHPPTSNKTASWTGTQNSGVNMNHTPRRLVQSMYTFFLSLLNCGKTHIIKFTTLEQNSSRSTEPKNGLTVTKGKGTGEDGWGGIRVGKKERGHYD